MHRVKKQLPAFIFSQWAIKHHESKLSNLLTSRFCLCSGVNNFYSHQPSICTNKSDWRRFTAAKPLQNQQVEYWNISFIAPHSWLTLVCTGAAKRCCCAPIKNELVVSLALSIRYMSCAHSEEVYAFTRRPMSLELAGTFSCYEALLRTLFSHTCRMLPSQNHTTTWLKFIFFCPNQMRHAYQIRDQKSIPSLFHMKGLSRCII